MKPIMKTITILLLLATPLTSSAYSQQGRPPSEIKAHFINVESEYQSLKEIKPLLENATDRSIYLFWFYPYVVQLLRLNDETGGWEIGREGYAWSISYGPFEVKPGETFDLYVSWHIAFDSNSRPEHFVLRGRNIQRPVRGRYKFRMTYALEEWELSRPPEKIYEVESAEFRINLR
jgi:hypothetical protein